MPLSKLVPVSRLPHLHSWLHHGWRGASAGQLSDCNPPYKTRISFFYLSSLGENAAAFLTFAVELPALSMSTHAGPWKRTIAPTTASLGTHHVSLEAPELHSQALLQAKKKV